MARLVLSPRPRTRHKVEVVDGGKGTRDRTAVLDVARGVLMSPQMAEYRRERGGGRGRGGKRRRRKGRTTGTASENRMMYIDSGEEEEEVEKKR